MFIAPPTVILPFLTKIAAFVMQALPKVTAVVNTLIANLPSFIEKVKPVAEVIFDLAKQAGKFTNVDSAEILGNRTLAAQEAEFEGDLVAHLNKNETSVGIEKYSKEDIHSSALMVMVSVLEDKYGSSIIDLVNLAAKNPEFFDAKRLSAYVDVCEKGDLSLTEIVDYFSSNLKAKASAQVEDKLFAVESNLQLSNEQLDVVNTLKQERE
jgi:hypothetical protein